MGVPSLLLLLEQGEVLVQLGLNLLHPIICVFGGSVQLLLQEAQADVGFTQLFTLQICSSLASSVFLIAVGGGA